MRDCNLEFSATSYSIQQEITSRFVFSLDSIPITYEIKQYRSSSNLFSLKLSLANEVVLRRVFDSENILL